MEKSIREYIKESIGSDLKTRIIELLNNSSATEDDGYQILNILDKSGIESVKSFLSGKGVSENVADQIVFSDRKNELQKFITGDLPTIDDLISGDKENKDNLADLFDGLSINLIRRIFDITSRGGHGAVGKGEYLMNIFIEGGSLDGTAGDVRIGDICIELKTTPHSHPTGTNFYPFQRVFDSLYSGFDMDDKELPRLFFKKSKMGSVPVNKFLHEYIDSKLGGKYGASTDKKVLRIIFDSLISQFDRNPEKYNSQFNRLDIGRFIKNGNLDIAEIVNLAGAIQTMFYMKELIDSKCRYICIIDEHSDKMHYVIRSCEWMTKIENILSVITQFDNSMETSESTGRSNTMKISRII